MYDSWIKNKDESGTKTNFVFSDELISENQKIPKNVTVKGIDLPSWFGNYNNKKIVVLGIDPLRDEKTFKKENNADIYKDVIIGTPYSLNVKDERDSNSAKYWAFVDGLVQTNYFVYCTDIYKTYYFDKLNETRSYNDSDYTKNRNHRDLLIAELELIKPDLIITLVSIAHTKLLMKKCPTISQSILSTKSFIELNAQKVDVYTMMHLGNSRGRNMKKFFDANGIDTSSINTEKKVDCAKKYIELLKNIT